MNAPPPAPTPPAPRRRSRWLRGGSVDIGDVLVQIIAVVVGILLALFINDWSSRRQQQATVNQAMRAIRAELAANRANLRHYATHMLSMADHMRASTKNRNQPPRPCYGWDGWDGFGGLAPIDAAYQTSIATPALAHMPFNEAQVVARIYGVQRFTLAGINLDVDMLLNHPRPLGFCAGIAEEIGRSTLQLDAAYATLIGPDTAVAPPTPTAARAAPPSRKSP